MAEGHRHSGSEISQDAPSHADEGVALIKRCCLVHKRRLSNYPAGNRNQLSILLIGLKSVFENVKFFY